jgi:hypothetical protein
MNKKKSKSMHRVLCINNFVYLPTFYYEQRIVEEVVQNVYF